MRQAGLVALAALLNLPSFLVNAETRCHTSQSPTDGFVANHFELHDALAGPVADLCTIGLHPGTDEVISHLVGDVIFNIARNKTAQDAKECTAAFALIVSQCIGGQNVGGRQIDGDIVYEVHHIADNIGPGAISSILERAATQGLGEKDSNGFSNTFGRDLLLDSRAPKAGKVKAKPKPKPKPKPTTKPKPKPKTTSKPKSTPTPKPVSKSKSIKATKTSSSVKPGATKTCKQMHALMLANQKKSGILAAREGFVGSRLSIEKRADKSTKACGISVDALPYPEKSNMVCTPSR
jgi:hypothetical protein